MLNSVLTRFGDSLVCDLLTLDKASSARVIDSQGFMHVTCNITKAAVNHYLGSEIPGFEKFGLDADKMYSVLRPPEELKKAAHTFDNLPLLDGHKPVDTDELEDPKVHRRVVGSSGTGTTFDGTYLKNSLVIWRAGAIDSVETKEQHELSCGYRYTFVKQSGFFEGVAYDGYMTNIRGNHIALVARGRAGSDVVVADSEREDIAQATSALAIVEALLKHEAEEPHHESNTQFDALRDAAISLKKFIDSESKETEPTTTGDSAPAKEYGMEKGKKRKISPQGQVMRGAILAYLTPRLAQDAAISPGEISTIVKNIAPDRFHKQVDALVGSVLVTFKGRIVEDSADKENLKTLLSGLAGEFANDGDSNEPEVAEDKKCEKCGHSMKAGVTHDCGMMAKDAESFVTKYELPATALDEFNAIINAHTGITGDNIVETNVETKPELAAVKPEAQPEPITQAAMDAALVAQRSSVIAEIGARFQAATDVKPFIGTVDPMASDSAEAIYKLALDAKKIATEGVHPSAYKSLLGLIKSEDTTTTTQDSADITADDAKSFYERYPSAATMRKG